MSQDDGSVPPVTERPGPVAWMLLILVRTYQLVVSPWIAPRCRFYPSCSAYAVTALRRHGALKGTWLAARRLLRCHPWNLGGIDHVPAKGATRRSPTGTTAPHDDLPTAADAADGPSADGHSTAA